MFCHAEGMHAVQSESVQCQLQEHIPAQYVVGQALVPTCDNSGEHRICIIQTRQWPVSGETDNKTHDSMVASSPCYLSTPVVYRLD